MWIWSLVLFQGPLPLQPGFFSFCLKQETWKSYGANKSMTVKNEWLEGHQAAWVNQKIKQVLRWGKKVKFQSVKAACDVSKLRVCAELSPGTVLIQSSLKALKRRCDSAHAHADNTNANLTKVRRVFSSCRSVRRSSLPLQRRLWKQIFSTLF